MMSSMVQGAADKDGGKEEEEGRQAMKRRCRTNFNAGNGGKQTRRHRRQNCCREAEENVGDVGIVKRETRTENHYRSKERCCVVIQNNTVNQLVKEISLTQ